MAKVDPNTQAHLEWMGFVQPHGLVVSAPALTHANAILNRNDTEGQALLKASVTASDDDEEPLIRDFEGFARSVLGWKFSPKFYTRVTDHSDAPEDLALNLPEYGETLHPEYAIRHRSKPKEGRVRMAALGAEARPGPGGLMRLNPGRGTLDATSHGRMERLLRATGVSAGLLFNGRALRLISGSERRELGVARLSVRRHAANAGAPDCGCDAPAAEPKPLADWTSEPSASSTARRESQISECR